MPVAPLAAELNGLIRTRPAPILLENRIDQQSGGNNAGKGHYHAGAAQGLQAVQKKACTPSDQGCQGHHQAGVHRCRTREADQEQPLVEGHTEQAADEEAQEVGAAREGIAAVSGDCQETQRYGSAGDSPASDA